MTRMVLEVDYTGRGDEAAVLRSLRRRALPRVERRQRPRWRLNDQGACMTTTPVRNRPVNTVGELLAVLLTLPADTPISMRVEFFDVSANDVDLQPATIHSITLHRSSEPNTGQRLVLNG